MPGKLRWGRLDLSEPVTLKRVLAILDQVIHFRGRNVRLEVRDRYHFTVPGRSLPSERGWYIICDPTGLPIYVGIAHNLNARLNTDDGSRDGFANPQRRSDPERNFIKAFFSAGFFESLSVVAIPETAFLQQLGQTCVLDDLDFNNIEKIINIFRANLLRCSPASPPA
jgi:hypothetical protein